MRVVKAERWHRVDTTSHGSRRCSACGSSQLVPTGETVLDSGSLKWYRVVRCGGCAYDLLEEESVAAVGAE